MGEAGPTLSSTPCAEDVVWGYIILLHPIREGPAQALSGQVWFLAR